MTIYKGGFFEESIGTGARSFRVRYLSLGLKGGNMSWRYLGRECLWDDEVTAWGGKSILGQRPLAIVREPGSVSRSEEGATYSAESKNILPTVVSDAAMKAGKLHAEWEKSGKVNVRSLSEDKLMIERRRTAATVASMQGKSEHGQLNLRDKFPRINENLPRINGGG
jgi:hypothetical protein